MVLFNGMKVVKADIPSYFNEYYYSAVMIYNRFKRFGFPWSGGWAEQPEYIVSLCEIFEATIDEHGRVKQKRQELKSGNSRRT